MTDQPDTANPPETRGESVVLTLRTTRSLRTTLDRLRGPLTRSCFAARALRFTLECLERNEPRAVEQFAAPAINDHFRGGKRLAKTEPTRPTPQQNGRRTIVETDPKTCPTGRLQEAR